MVNFGLEGRVVIITGAGRGIGQAIALHLADEKAITIVADIDEGAAKETIAQIKKVGGTARAFTCDVRKQSEIQSVVDGVINEFGKIDGMVNNAGIRNFGLVTDYTEEEWDAVIDINLKGVFLSAQAAAKAMQKQKSGVIVSISSVAAFGGGGGCDASGQHDSLRQPGRGSPAV